MDAARAAAASAGYYYNEDIENGIHLDSMERTSNGQQFPPEYSTYQVPATKKQVTEVGVQTEEDSGCVTYKWVLFANYYWMFIFWTFQIISF